MSPNRNGVKNRCWRTGPERKAAFPRPDDTNRIEFPEGRLPGALVRVRVNPVVGGGLFPRKAIDWRPRSP